MCIVRILPVLFTILLVSPLCGDDGGGGAQAVSPRPIKYSLGLGRYLSNRWQLPKPSNISIADTLSPRASC